jgi:hypothetical protein
MPTYTAPFGQMYLPMSDEWYPALASTVLGVACYAELWTGLQLPNSEQENVLTLGSIPIISGTVTIDRNNTVRRTATDVVLDPSFSDMLLPLVNQIQVDDKNLFAPYSAELRIYKGLNEGTEADPSFEYACLGIFQITEVDVIDDASGCLLEGTMSDRAGWVQDRVFAAPYSGNGTHTVDVAIRALLDDAIGTIGMSLLPFTVNLPSSDFVPAVTTYDVGDDPWQGVTDLASAAGLQLYFDYDGVLQLAAIPNPLDGTVCISYLEGSTPSGVTIKRILENGNNAPNVVCVQSQGSNVATQYQVWRWDDNPYWPTFYADTPSGGWSTPQTTLVPQSADARYPRNILTISTSQIPTTNQGADCQAMANATWLLQLGIVENCTIELRENPAHDVDDLIQIQRLTSGVYIVDGETEEPVPVSYVVDQVTLDLTASKNITLTARPVSFYGT